MRLKTVLTSRTPGQLEAFDRIKDRVGFEPGPLLTMSYCHELFGKHWVECMQEGMRRTRFWSLGDVELFGAYISKLNACAY